MNRATALLARLLLAASALIASSLFVTACTDPEPEHTGLSVARFALIPALANADAIDIAVHGPDGELATHRFEAPWEDDARVPLSVGPDRHLELSARIGDLPLAEGSSARFDAPATGVVDVEIVIDLLGVLDVAPLGIPLEAVLGVSARPLAPYDGQPGRYDLIEADGAFSLELPVGRYALDFELEAAFIDWLPAVTAEVTVIAGARQVWAEPLIDPIIEPPIPGAAETLEMIVEGGGLDGGLFPEPRDLTVRAIDADGRAATGYRGTVQFEVLVGIDLLGLELLRLEFFPPPYEFTEDDAGTHLFEDALQAVSSLLAGTVRLQISDDTGLMTTLDIPVAP